MQGLCVSMIMVRSILSISNYGALYTTHTRPLPSEMKSHKVFRASFTLITWTPGNPWRSAACLVLISSHFEFTRVCEFPLSQFVAWQHNLPMRGFTTVRSHANNRSTPQQREETHEPAWLEENSSEEGDCCSDPFQKITADLEPLESN